MIVVRAIALHLPFFLFRSSVPSNHTLLLAEFSE